MGKKAYHGNEDEQILMQDADKGDQWNRGKTFTFGNAGETDWVSSFKPKGLQK